MHCIEVLSRFIKEICPEMHSTRRESVTALVESCMRSERAFITGLGRNIRSNAHEKHNIKRADRLLSNEHLWQELDGIYGAICKMLLPQVKSCNILVDWSNLDKGKKHYLLRASLAMEGRGITLYEEVHDISTKEKPSTHKHFLQQLKQLLPDGIKPVIITDAGFRITWFEEVEKLGWHWLGRIRGHMNVKLEGTEKWQDGRLLHPVATANAKEYRGSIGKSKDISCKLVLFKGKPKKRKLLNAFGKPRKAIRSKQAQQRGREPWLLATSLNISPKRVVQLYGYRMQIEESFRDTKSKSFGIGLKFSRSYKIERIRVLVLLTTLTNTFAWLLGKATEKMNKHFAFQANTTSSSRVLSFVFLGLKVFKKQFWYIPYQHFLRAIDDSKLFIKAEQCW